MGILAGTWLSIGLVTLTSPAGSTSDALGLLVLIAAVAMLVPTSAASLGKIVAFAVLATTAVHFATSGLHQLTGSGAWEHVAGVTGLVLCALAVCAALAMALEDAGRHTGLPVLRRGEGHSSLEGNLEDQLGRIEREAGVREQR